MATIIAKYTRIPFPVSISWRVIHCRLVCFAVCSGVPCIVDLSCQYILLHVGVTMVIMNINYIFCNTFYLTSGCSSLRMIIEEL